MNDTAPQLWRIGLAAEAHSQAAFAAVLEEVTESVSAFESTPGGIWRIEALTTTEPDRRDIGARLAEVAAAIGAEAPEVEIGVMPKVDWLAENRRAFPPLFGSNGQGRLYPAPTGSIFFRFLRFRLGFGFGLRFRRFRSRGLGSIALRPRTGFPLIIRFVKT